MSSRTRSDFGTLGERLAATRATQSEATPAPTSTATPGHRWVLIDGVEEALIAKWRRDPNGSWEGLIARAGGTDDFWAEWIPAQRLTAHQCDPHPARG